MKDYTKPINGFLFLSRMNKHFDMERLEEQVQVCKELNRNQLNTEKLKQMYTNVHVYYNSLNLSCGPQGAGKTFTACKELAKIMQVDPQAHLLIVVFKSENSTDPRVATFTSVFHLAVKCVSEEVAEEYGNNMLDYERLYNQIREERWEGLIADDRLEELFSTLSSKTSRVHG